MILESTYNIILTVAGIILSIITIIDYEQFSILWKRSFGGQYNESNLYSGRVVRAWFIISIGITNIILTIGRLFVVILLTKNINSSNIDGYSDVSYLFSKYIPTIAYLSLYALIAIYLIELSLTVTGELNTSLLITYWQLFTVFVTVVFSVIVFKPTLHFLLFYIFFLEHVFVLVLIAWGGKIILDKIPRTSLKGITNNMQIQVYRRLQPVYYLTIISLSITTLYSLLIALEVLPSEMIIIQTSSIYSTIDFLIPLFTQVIWTLVILYTIHKSSSADTTTLSSTSSTSASSSSNINGPSSATSSSSSSSWYQILLNYTWNKILFQRYTAGGSTSTPTTAGFNNNNNSTNNIYRPINSEQNLNVTYSTFHSLPGPSQDLL